MPERDAAIQRLLAANAQWAQDVSKQEPDFFEQSAKGQSPHVRCSILTHSDADVPYRLSG